MFCLFVFPRVSVGKKCENVTTCAIALGTKKKKGKNGGGGGWGGRGRKAYSRRE